MIGTACQRVIFVKLESIRVGPIVRVIHHGAVIERGFDGDVAFKFNLCVVVRQESEHKGVIVVGCQVADLDLAKRQGGCGTEIVGMVIDGSAIERQEA